MQYLVKYIYVSDLKIICLKSTKTQINLLPTGSDISAMEHRIVIIWRREATRIQYEWLNETWPVCTHAHCTPDQFPADPAARDELLKYHERLNETKRALDQLIKRLLKPTEVMAYEAHVQVCVGNFILI